MRVRRSKGRAAIRLESLEVRQLLVDSLPIITEFRTYDGTGNNLLHNDWGAVGTDLLRIAPPGYADGISSPAGSSRPGPRP